jgi:hypothetical protein
VSRLDNIIARNQRGKRPNEKVLVTLVLAVIILVLIVLAVFTDLGKPPIPAHAGEGAAGSAAGSAEPPANQRHNYAPGILLRSSSQRPATQRPATAPSPTAQPPTAPSPTAPSPTAPSPTATPPPAP